RARGRARHPLQPACAQAAHIAVSSRCRGQRRRGRRRRQPCARLRHRAGGTLGDLRAGLRQDPPHPRLRGHVAVAAAGRAPPRPRGLALTAEPLPADKAEAWGLIWKTLDDLELMAQAHQLCVHFTAAPTVALALIKRALDEAWANDLDAQLDLERESQREA